MSRLPHRLPPKIEGEREREYWRRLQPSGLRAVNGCAHFGAPPAGAKGCPVGEAIPRAVAGAIKAADAAAAERLARITVADLLNSASTDVAA